MHLRSALIGAGLALLTASGLAQAPLPEHLAFDVVSVKQNRSGNVSGSLRVQTGGRLVMTNVSLRAIIATAFGTTDAPLRDSQIASDVGWLRTDRFDVEAKPPSGLGVIALRATEMREMLRTLLTERFQLAVHQETRQQSAYALTIVRSDRQLGHQLRPVDVDCLALLAAQRAADPTGAGTNIPLCSLKGTQGNWVGHGYRIGQLADLLANEIHGVVQDHTGLGGSFDFELSWQPDSTTATAPSVDADKPSIFTAVQEQLGLKLESHQEPVDVLVIDRVEHPAEN